MVSTASRALLHRKAGLDLPGPGPDGDRTCREASRISHYPITVNPL